uniref:Uncharacterized protein n=1 Tax=Arundo donax TaxID=35708 RepID=A0A0A9DVH8_ARUDO
MYGSTKSSEPTFTHQISVKNDQIEGGRRHEVLGDASPG